jgi:hypothetical protein
MRMLAFFSLASLVAGAGCVGQTHPADYADCGGFAPCAGLVDLVRVENFAVNENGSFTWGAQTNTAMTENDDGGAERLRRQWLAETLEAHAMCEKGYVVDTRRFVTQPVGPFANGGDIVYSGRCL